MNDLTPDEIQAILKKEAEEAAEEMPEGDHIEIIPDPKEEELRNLRIKRELEEREENLKKDQFITEILNNIKEYNYNPNNINQHTNSIYNNINNQEQQQYKQLPSDPVDLYLKNRGINKKASNVYITTNDYINNQKGMYSHPSLVSKIIKMSQAGMPEVVGINQIFLTQDGKKLKGNDGKSLKFQRIYSKYKEYTGSKKIFNPLILPPKGKNNSIIFVTEGLENALSIQENYNNEIWCSLSKVNLASLPYDPKRIYCFYLDNDNKQGLKNYDPMDDIIISKLKSNDFDNHRFFYIYSPKETKDANDDLVDGRIKKIIDAHWTPIDNKRYYFCSDGDKKKKTNQKIDIKEPNITPEKLQPPDGTEHETFQLPLDRWGLLQRFVIKYRNKYRFVIEKNRFFTYKDGKYYELSKKEVKTSIQTDIFNTLFSTANEFPYYTNAQAERFIKKFSKFGNYAIHELEKLIKTNENFATLIEYFDDINNNTINFKNELLDLDNIKKIKHSPETMNFNQINYDFNYTGYHQMKGTTLFDKFLNDMFSGNQEQINFLQKCLGYTLSNHTKEHKIFVIEGVTRSGKTLLLKLIGDILGDYGTYATHKLITANDTDNFILDELADTKGKRFIHISEIPSSKKINGNLLKNMAGDGMIAAAKKFESKIVFKSQLKLWIAANKFSLNDYSDSVKERIVLFRANNQFYEKGTIEAEKTGRVIDRDMETKLSTNDSIQYIINWMIEGYRRYKEEGLLMPDFIKQNLKTNELEEDKIAYFINDHLLPFDKYDEPYLRERESVESIYTLYRAVEIDTFKTPENEIIGMRKFFKLIKSKGFEIERVMKNGSRRNYITGYCLKHEWQLLHKGDEPPPTTI
ncbi:MAG: hypothetical protein LBH46_04390 [Rickettsiales bacterium]|jgi:P4 family phage/plasmid primase-like protien|nr:hypothetical protein [Rickettsiales bacterium]